MSDARLREEVYKKYQRALERLEDIAVIAKKARDDTEEATESDWAAILSGALADIIKICEKERA